MISFISVCEPDELVEVVGHACVLVDVVDLHLDGSFGLFFDHLSEDVVTHLLAYGLPAFSGINVTELVDGEDCSFHADNDRFAFPAREFVDSFAVCCQTSLFGINAREVVQYVF